MAILQETYYYFVLKNETTPYKIKVRNIPINTTIMAMYREMTTEQREFYLANPTATVMEVWNCELTPPYVPPTPDVQEYAAMKVRELHDVCYASVTITSLEYAAAEDKVNNVLVDNFYSLTEANKVLADFRTQSKKALTIISTYTPQIKEASTIEAIDTLYNTAIEQL